MADTQQLNACNKTNKMICVPSKDTDQRPAQFDRCPYEETLGS